MFGAIAGAVGGVLDNIARNKANQASMDFAREQFQYQQDLHRNQIQWRVEDAKKAGVHPMAALGLSSMSFSPVSSPTLQAADYNWLGDIGQNADRAIQQGKTRAERKQAQALQDRLTDIQIRRGEAEADLAETEAAAARFRLQQQLFPAPPPADGSTGIISGQGDAKPSIPTGGYGSADALLDLARHGRTLLDVINPDLADSITESTYRSAIANVASEWENVAGYVRPPVDFLTSKERRDLAAGLIDLKRYPGMWRIVDTPIKRNKDAVRRYDAAYGRDAWHNPRSWKWLDRLGQQIKDFFD